MTVLGLTGGVGTGKSTAAAWLGRQGLPIIDTDVIARDLVEFGQPALAEIASAFGNDVIDASGRLNRSEMARRIFASSPARQKLEGILHPRIRTEWLAQAERLRVQGRGACVVVIPLLFETGAETQVDVTLCVACSAGSQQQRLLARGWAPAHVQQRIAAQWPAERKIVASDFVVWSEGSLELHHEQLSRVTKVLGLDATPA